MRITIVHWIAKALGVLIHVGGRPYGSDRNIQASGGGPCGALASSRER